MMHLTLRILFGFFFCLILFYLFLVWVFFLGGKGLLLSDCNETSEESPGELVGCIRT